MKILFVRHAAAVDHENFKGASDLDRPLTKEGRSKAETVFKRLAEVYHKPGIILSSEAVRARQTAEILAKCLGNNEVVTTNILNPGCCIESFEEMVKMHIKKYESMAVVGHEPDFSGIISALVSDGSLRIDVKKASCIEVDVNSILKGVLTFAIPPKWMIHE